MPNIKIAGPEFHRLLSLPHDQLKLKLLAKPSLATAYNENGLTLLMCLETSYDYIISDNSLLMALTLLECGADPKAKSRYQGLHTDEFGSICREGETFLHKCIRDWRTEASIRQYAFIAWDDGLQDLREIEFDDNKYKNLFLAAEIFAILIRNYNSAELDPIKEFMHAQVEESKNEYGANMFADACAHAEAIIEAHYAAAIFAVFFSDETLNNRSIKGPAALTFRRKDGDHNVVLRMAAMLGPIRPHNLTLTLCDQQLMNYYRCSLAQAPSLQALAGAITLSIGQETSDPNPNRCIIS